VTKKKSFITVTTEVPEAGGIHEEGGSSSPGLRLRQDGQVLEVGLEQQDGNLRKHRLNHGRRRVLSSIDILSKAILSTTFN